MGGFLLENDLTDSTHKSSNDVVNRKINILDVLKINIYVDFTMKYDYYFRKSNWTVTIEF